MYLFEGGKELLKQIAISLAMFLHKKSELNIRITSLDPLFIRDNLNTEVLVVVFTLCESFEPQKCVVKISI